MTVFTCATVGDLVDDGICKDRKEQAGRMAAKGDSHPTLNKCLACVDICAHCGLPSGAKQRWNATQKMHGNCYTASSKVGGSAPDPAPPRAQKEVDPTGLLPEQPGAKLDAGKPRMSLVMGGFSNALQEVGRVGTFGAKKYSDNGWHGVPNGKERYTDALYRHLLQDGPDAESGIEHAAHAAWNALARLELLLRGG